MRGVEKKIKALKDCELRTYYERHVLIKNEVKVVRFKNKWVIEELLKLGNFKIAGSDEPVAREIPILLPEVDEDELIAVEDGKILLPMQLTEDDVDISEDGIDHENKT